MVSGPQCAACNWWQLGCDKKTWPTQSVGASLRSNFLSIYLSSLTILRTIIGLIVDVHDMFFLILFGIMVVLKRLIYRPSEKTSR